MRLPSLVQTSEVSGISRALVVSYSDGQIGSGSRRHLELNPSAKVPPHVLRPQHVLDRRTHANLQHSAFNWVKSLGSLLVRGRSVRSLISNRQSSLFWVFETPLWDGDRSPAVPPAHQMALTIGAMKRLIEEEPPSEVQLEGNTAASLVQIAAEAARSCGIPVSSQGKSHSRLEMPMSLRASLIQLVLTWRRLEQSATMKSGLTLFVSYASRIRIAGGGEDSNIQKLSTELDRRNEPWAAVIVDNAADAKRPWHASRRAFPRHYVPLEGLISSGPAAAARRVALRIGRVLRENGAALGDQITFDGVPLGRVYSPILWRIATRHVPTVAYYHDAFRETIDRFSPARMVVLNETGTAGRAAIAAGNEMGIPTVGLQHGIIAPLHVEYLHPRGILAPCSTEAYPVPSRTVLDGEYYREVLESNSYPAGSVTVCGSARYEAFLDRLRAHASRSREHVTLVTQSIDDIETFKGIAASISQVPGARLAVRPHPLEDPSRYRRALDELGIPAPILAQEELAEVFSRSVAVVASFTTAVIEANLAGLPVALLNLTREDDYVPFEERGGALGVRDVSEIIPVVTDLLEHGPGWRRLEATRPTFLDAFSYKADGAAARVVEAILRTKASSVERSRLPSPKS